VNPLFPPRIDYLCRRFPNKGRKRAKNSGSIDEWSRLRLLSTVILFIVFSFTANVKDAAPMITRTEYLWFETEKRRQFLNITDQVADIVATSGVTEGMVLVSAMHITAGIWVNDAEAGLLADIDEWLEKLAPFGPDYRHHRTGEDNGDAHLKSLLVHHQVVIPITGGELDFGPWQQVYYAEFDGRRKKRVVVKVMGA
jgi:secondary thiamine-phosphate synthase enzyme